MEIAITLAISISAIWSLKTNCCTTWTQTSLSHSKYFVCFISRKVLFIFVSLNSSPVNSVRLSWKRLFMNFYFHFISESVRKSTNWNCSIEWIRSIDSSISDVFLTSKMSLWHLVLLFRYQYKSHACFCCFLSVALRFNSQFTWIFQRKMQFCA